jgi:hypothetical protein
VSIALFLLANAAVELGRSPLVDTGHEHDWVNAISDSAGDGWMDDRWRLTETLEGRALKLVLFRGIPKQAHMPKMDMIMAVDCARNLIGIKGAFLHPPAKTEAREVPLANVTMDFADTPPAAQDRAIIGFACKAGEEEK